MAKEKIRRVFLSYSSENREEVIEFDRELRRRGVPLWRDRVNLPRGRDIREEIERASLSAIGFVFYLTLQAADSEYVRETELKYARLNADRVRGFGIVPIFRSDLKEVVDRMIRLGKNPTTSKVARSHYDLSDRAGYKVREEKPLETELKIAADFVLDSLLHTLGDQNDSDRRLRIGLATRGAPLGRFDLDLLVDWSPDYPGLDEFPNEYLREDSNPATPNPEFCAIELAPALQSLWKNIKKYWHNLKLQIVPQCHLSMAFAAGFKFGRNTGVDLEVVEPNTEEVWRSPRRPEKPDSAAWTFDLEEINQSGKELAVGINISSPGGGPRKSIRDYVSAAIPEAGKLLYFEPASGASRDSLSNRGETDVHRMACAVLSEVQALRPSKTHLFYAGPPGLAILIGQQMPNAGQFQVYEYHNAQRRYSPAFLLSS